MAMGSGCWLRRRDRPHRDEEVYNVHQMVALAADCSAPTSEFVGCSAAVMYEHSEQEAALEFFFFFYYSSTRSTATGRPRRGCSCELAELPRPRGRARGVPWVYLLNHQLQGEQVVRERRKLGTEIVNLAAAGTSAGCANARGAALACRHCHWHPALA